MNLIAAVDRNWAIGKEGKLLVSIPADQQLFRQETLGKAVIMGRGTLESLPGGRPLYGRTTLVLSRNPDWAPKGAVVCRSVEEALREAARFDSRDVFVAGGQQIYEAFLPYCDTAHITFIDYVYEADAWFPNLDRMPDWNMDLESEEQTYFDLCYTFRRYVRTGAAAAPKTGGGMEKPRAVGLDTGWKNVYPVYYRNVTNYRFYDPDTCGESH